MLKTQKCVYDMMVALNLPLPKEVGPTCKDLKYDLRRNLVKEEFEEFYEAMGLLKILNDEVRDDGGLTIGHRIVVMNRVQKRKIDEQYLVKVYNMKDQDFIREMKLFWWSEVIDGICDCIVVLHNTTNAMGVDIEPYFDEVHRTNMLKAEGPLREDGKRLKPEGWKPPRIREMLERELANNKEFFERFEEGVKNGRPYDSTGGCA